MFALAIGLFALASVALAAEPPGLAASSGGGKARVQALIQAALKEGEVSWRASITKDETARKLVDAFRAYYGLPASFKVTYDTDMATPNLVSKTQAEVDAGRLTADIISTGSIAWVSDLKGLGHLMKYDAPVFKEYGPAERAGICEPGYYVADAYTMVPVWNTKLVPKGLKTWEDLLNPAFKGKFMMGDIPRSGTQLAHYIALRNLLGKQYWEAVAKQQPVLFPRAEDSVTKTATGEFWVSQNGMPSRVYQGVVKGAPVDFCFPDKGVLLIPQVWTILAKAPHPNAAKLWIDFIFSERGQQVHQAGEALMSGRQGFKPPAEIARYAPPIEKIKVAPFDWKAYTPAMQKAASDEISAILAAAK